MTDKTAMPLPNLQRFEANQAGAAANSGDLSTNLAGSAPLASTPANVNAGDKAPTMLEAAQIEYTKLKAELEAIPAFRRFLLAQSILHRCFT